MQDSIAGSNLPDIPCSRSGNAVCTGSTQGVTNPLCSVAEEGVSAGVCVGSKVWAVGSAALL